MCHLFRRSSKSEVYHSIMFLVILEQFVIKEPAVVLSWTYFNGNFLKSVWSVAKTFSWPEDTSKFLERLFYRMLHVFSQNSVCVLLSGSFSIVLHSNVCPTQWCHFDNVHISWNWNEVFECFYSSSQRRLFLNVFFINFCNIHRKTTVLKSFLIKLLA